MTFETYPKNSLVKIKDPGRRPGNWNVDMMKLIGKHVRIKKSDEHGDYRYYLGDMKWVWRHCDLELVELPKLDPNTEFRSRKRAIRRDKSRA
jgi:hypothetical protein